MTEQTIQQKENVDPDSATFDKIRKEADEKREAKQAERQKTEEFFNRMKTDNLII